MQKRRYITPPGTMHIIVYNVERGCMYIVFKEIAEPRFINVRGAYTRCQGVS